LYPDIKGFHATSTKRIHGQIRNYDGFTDTPCREFRHDALWNIKCVLIIRLVSIWHVNGLFPIEIKNSIGIVTLKNQLNKMNSLNLKQVFRNLKNNKLYSFITIFGLAVGMAATILLFIYTRHELSYDRFHMNANRIYRLNSILTQEVSNTYKICIGMNDSLLQKQVPEIEEVFQMYDLREIELMKDNIRFKNIPFIYADPNIYKVFTVKYLRGNRKSGITGFDA